MSRAYVADYDTHFSSFNAHISGKTGQPLAPSFVQPAGYWTSREKECFFHALAVHSRLRPDLIAESIKSKTVLDVCAYLDVLDDAAAAWPLQTPLRSTLECAMEVSDSWVQHEEEQASGLTALEPGWEREAEEQRRSLLLAGRFQDEPTFWSWKQQQEEEWTKEDALAQLDIQHLQVMDRLIRNTTFESSLANLPGASTSNVMLVDPLLPSEQPHSPSQENRMPDQGPSRILPQYPAPAGTHSPISNTQQSPKDALPEHLSPTSVRRLYSRLYMRKKRAQAKGTEVNLTPTRLAGGRKTTKVHIPKPKPHKYKRRKKNSQSDDDQEVPSASSPEDDIPYHSKSGVTRPYKMQGALQNKGIDGDTLTDSGFDIFNLHRIGKLMRLFHNVYPNSDGKAIASYISSDTIALLRDILVDFTSRVVHRAISMREQEVILKRNIKVWRLDKESEITAANVLDALQMLGLNKRSLLSDFGSDNLKDTYPDDSISDQADNACADENHEAPFLEDDFLFPSRLTLHRELVPPFVVPRRKLENTNLPAETDPEDELAELDDESKLDDSDRQLELAYEKELWQAARA
ncbi:hypothetical protein B0H15DRAFT_396258 [Mycena belliarum]|uniref:Uncharacterized protein n=1 Tax=Mycena belliarum TaxID=1033014 RepID=A0AAD6TZ23_9AGAR|nr:hypothetical protein B0H15DRAFT_396258 [Mycena belliae]